MSKDNPQFCRIVGGKDNGKYMHEGKLYRRDGDDYYNIETGNKAGGKSNRRIGQKDSKPPAKRSPEDVKAEREAEQRAAEERAAELKAQQTRTENKTAQALNPGERVKQLMSDYSGVEIAQMLAEVKADQVKANGESDIEINLDDTPEAARANAELLTKHTEA